MSVKKYLTLNGLTYFLNKIKTYLTSSTYLNSIGISNSDIDDIADDAGYSSGSLPASEDIFITGDIIPNTDNSVDLGASSKNIKMIYTKGITINGVACGDILTHNASEFAYDTNVVHKSGNETIRGNKHFNGNYVDVNGYRLRIKNTVEVAGELPTAENPWTSNRWSGFNFVDKNNVRTFEISRGAISNGWTFVNFGVLNNASNTWFDFFKYEGNSSVSYVSSIDFVPRSNNTYELGSSTNKWKTINGVNPGALSYPNKTSYINIDTTNWDLTCSNQGVMANYVVEQSGWLELQIVHGSADIVDFWVITGSIRMNTKSTFNTLDNRNFNMISLPVVEGDTLIIYGNASQYVAGRQIDHARIYTGLGQA